MSGFKNQDYMRSIITNIMGSTEGSFYMRNDGSRVDIRTLPIQSTGQSGLSFGLSQMDVANNPAAEQLFNDLLEDAFNEGRITSQQKSDWEARAATPGIGSSQDAFTPQELADIREKVLEPNKGMICDADHEQIDDLLEGMNDLRDAIEARWGSAGALDENASDFLLAFGHLLSWQNRTGPFTTTLDFLTGEEVPGLDTLTAAPTYEDIQYYLENQAQFENNSGEYANVTGNIERGLNLLEQMPSSYAPCPSEPFGPELPPGWTQGAADAWNTAPTLGSPLILDIDGDGIELTAFNATSTDIFFDIDNDGFAEQTAWIMSDQDGFLVRDLNENGVIEGTEEMFGSATVDGFAILATLDDNSDHVINQYDAEWSNLLVWKDKNGDAISQSDELLTLTSLDIVSFDLAEISPSSSIINGNPISHTSTFKYGSGTTAEIVDAWFVHDNMNTYFVGDYQLDIRTMFMPALRGFGEIPSLYAAMSMDEDLLDLVDGFAQSWDYERFEDAGSLNTDIEEILFTWAGVEDVGYSSRGPHIDARRLEFMEKFFGQKFVQLGEYTDPFFNAAAKLNESWEKLFYQMKAQLLVQVGVSTLFDNTINYNPFTGEFEGSMDISQAAIDALETLATSTITDDLTFWKQVAEFLAFTKGFTNMTGGEATMLDDAIQATLMGWDWDSIQPASVPSWVGVSAGGSPDDDIINGTSGNDTLDGGVGNDEVYGHNGNDTLEGGTGDDIVNGGDGTDTLYGEDGHDILDGGNDADTVYGGNGNDVIYGRAGNDNLYGGTGGNTIYGGDGNDAYFYQDGNDVYDELTNSGTDTIKLASGIVLNDLTFSRHASVTNETLFIDIDGIGTIETPFFNSNAGSLLTERIETITFFDTSTYTLDSFTALTTYGTEGDDYLNGIYTTQDIDDTIYGKGGNDEIQTEGGNDTLDGGDGNDTLKGGLGDDIYLASAGFDTISFEYGGNDTLVLPDGIDAEDVSLLRRVGAPDTLEITITGLGQIRITDQFYSSGDYTVETLSFDGLSTVNLTDLQIETIGTSGNDSIYGIDAGASIDDILDGREGDDTLSGAYGADTYFFSSGTDTVAELGGVDTIAFRAGVIPANIVVYRSINGGSDFDDLFIEDLTGNKLIVDEHFSNVDRSVEQIIFADSTTWLIASLEIETRGTSGADYIDDVAFGYASLADTIYGYAGADQIYGGAGNDILDGGADNDYMDGEADNDTVTYATAASAVTINLATTTGQNTGGSGTDTILNIENLVGSSYNDTLTGDGNANIIEGGAGNDTINGAGGTDTVSYASAGSAVTVNLATTTGQNTGGAGTDTITNTENLRGSAYNDTLTGTSGNNVIEGGAGDDTINAQGGTDTLTYANASGAVTVSLALVTAQNTGGAGTDTVSNFENLTGSAYGDTLTGSTAANTINGGDGDDTVEGGAGNDTLVGGSGTDTVSYINAGSAITFNLATTSEQNTVGAGTDTVSGFENVTGSAYNDTLTGNSSANVIEGGAGNDTINGSGGTDTLSYASAVSAITVNLSTATGQNTGGAGTDTISSMENVIGSSYNDNLTGTSSANTMIGGSGNDTISAGGGADFLYGGAGTDTLTGSTGGDAFIFEAATALGASDTITDFSTAQVDKLDVSDILDGYDPLSDAISDFIRITDNGTHSFLSVDADGGGNSFTQIAQLSSVTNIAAGATATEIELQAMITAGTLLAA